MTHCVPYAPQPQCKQEVSRSPPLSLRTTYIKQGLFVRLFEILFTNLRVHSALSKTRPKRNATGFLVVFRATFSGPYNG